MRRSFLITAVVACQSPAPPRGTVVAADRLAEAITVDSSRVYWVTGTEVDSAPLGADAVTPTPIVAGLALWYPDGIAVDDQFVYWSDAGAWLENNGSIMKAPKGGGGTPAPVVTGIAPEAMALDATNVYWTTGTQIWEQPLAGGPAVEIVFGRTEANAIAVDANNLYWVSDQQVGRVSLATHLVTFLGAAIFPAKEIAVDAANVYWTSGGTAPQGDVRSIPIGGGAPVDLAPGEDLPSGVAVDATGVYWTTNGKVRRAPIGGGAVQTLAANDDGGYHPIVLDATDVYWGAGEIHSELPSIRRIPKVTP